MHTERPPWPPLRFCWTRFGTEAGERIDEIIRRKEIERRACGGRFFWGIGNAVGPGVGELVRQTAKPVVVFSPISGRPRPRDVTPTSVVRWLAAETPSGDHFELPPAVRITSRAGSRYHYALVCACDEPLRLEERGRVDFGTLRNLRSGNPLGASQVTAVVQRVATPGGRSYPVAMTATLVAPYVVRLVDPVLVGGDEQSLAGPLAA
jgi:hypothetical protein